MGESQVWGLEKVGESRGESLEFESQIKVCEISQIQSPPPPITPPSASVREGPLILDPTSYDNVRKLALSNQINGPLEREGSIGREERVVGRKVVFKVKEEDVMAENGHQERGT